MDVRVFRLIYCACIRSCRRTKMPRVGATRPNSTDQVSARNSCIRRLVNLQLILIPSGPRLQTASGSNVRKPPGMSRTPYFLKPKLICSRFCDFESVIDRNSCHPNINTRFSGSRLGLSRKIEECFATASLRRTHKRCGESVLPSDAVDLSYLFFSGDRHR